MLLFEARKIKQTRLHGENKKIRATKEWYLNTELSRIWWWFREESDVHLMPILDDNIPRLPDEMQISAAPCFPGKPNTENIIRVVPVASAVPLFEYYSNDETGTAHAVVGKGCAMHAYQPYASL